MASRPRARPRVHLLDAHVYVFRAWFSLPAMPAPDGSPTGAAYGFASTLIRYLREAEPSHVATCFDYALTSFRNELCAAYKASRLDAPPELEAQFRLCEEASRALGVPAFSREGYEADDVIATLAERLRRRRADVVVVTSDKDLAQCVRGERVVLFDLARERTLDAAGVEARFGVPPERVPDWLALVGDAVDELPGVPGFGAKTAAAALGHFGGLEALPTEARAWEGAPVRGAARLAAAWREHRERAFRVRELATVRRDVPELDLPPSQLAWRGADREAARALFERLGWGRIASRVPRWA